MNNFLDFKVKEMIIYLFVYVLNSSFYLYDPN